MQTFLSCPSAHLVNKRNIGAVIAAAWLCSLFWSGSPLLGWGSYRGTVSWFLFSSIDLKIEISFEIFFAARRYGTCEIDWTRAVYSVPVKLYVICIFFFNFFVPVSIIVFSYASIIRTVNSSHKCSRGGDVSERQRKIERRITRVKPLLQTL